MSTGPLGVVRHPLLSRDHSAANQTALHTLPIRATPHASYILLGQSSTPINKLPKQPLLGKHAFNSLTLYHTNMALNNCRGGSFHPGWIELSFHTKANFDPPFPNQERWCFSGRELPLWNRQSASYLVSFNLHLQTLSILYAITL